MSKSKKKNSTTRRVLKITIIVLTVLLLLILAVAAVVFIYVDGLMDKINYVPETGGSVETLSPEDATSMEREDWITIPSDGTVPTIHVTDITFVTEPAPPEEQGDHIINVLVVGQDARPGEGRQRSDSMMMITVNKITNEITLTSFTRDQFVQIPGYGNTKLCHAYAYGGMDLLNRTLYNHYGVEIDGNIEIDFSAFKEIVDMLGGVEMTITEKEAKVMNQKGGGRWTVTAGTHVLTGDQALQYSRIRHIDSDYERTNRQRKVLLSLIEAYKDSSLTEMMAIMEEILPMITTNIPKDRIYRYALTVFPMLAETEVGSQRLPVNGTFKDGLVKVAEGYMGSCQYDIDFAANRRILAKLFDEEPG